MQRQAYDRFARVRFAEALVAFDSTAFAELVASTVDNVSGATDFARHVYLIPDVQANLLACLVRNFRVPRAC